VAAASNVRSPRKRARALLAAAALVLALPASVSGGPSAHPNPGTSFVTNLPAGALAIPLINSGETFDGTTFEGIPDGLGIMPVGNGKKQVDIFVNFEQSHVPFGGFADHEDSSVQRARLDLATHQIVQLETMLPASAGYIRFCSANMVGPDQGFSDYTFLTNEESNDVLRVSAGQPYGADPGLAPYRQAGYSVYLDASTGSFKTIAGAGRLNHENTLVVPGGWKGAFALTSDDTFTAPGSQLYLYGASSPGAFKQDRGSLWAFRVTHKNGSPVTATDPQNGANDYLDIAPGDTLKGEFIPVPDGIARGTSGNPQTELENWSNANNVFQFIRVEDIGYDPDSPRTVYFTDTGSTRIGQSASTGRLFRPAATAFPYYDTDGRVFKMVMNPSDPKVVDSLQVLAQGKLQLQQAGALPTDPPVITVIDPGVGFLNPDNVGVGHDTLMVQEDASTNPTNNDIWSYPLAGGSWNRVATVSQTLAETSGIIDASQWLGPGWWVFDVQSHSTQQDFGTGSYTVPITNVVISGFTIRRELGQLSLLYIPGS
jgi:hypothetical protein